MEEDGGCKRRWIEAAIDGGSRRAIRAAEAATTLEAVAARLEQAGSDVDPREHFQSDDDLRSAVARYRCSSPTPQWAGEVGEEIALFQQLVAGRSEQERRILLRQVAREAGERDRRAEVAVLGVRRRIVPLMLLARGVHLEHSQQAVFTACLEDNYVRARNRIRHPLQAIVEAAGLGPDPAVFGSGSEQIDQAYDLMAALINSMFEGATLRTNFDPLGSGIELPTGDEGGDEHWHLAGLITHVVFSALTTPTEVEPRRFEELAPVAHPAVGWSDGPADEVVQAAFACDRRATLEQIRRSPDFGDLVPDGDHRPEQIWSSTDSLAMSMVEHLAEVEPDGGGRSWYDIAREECVGPPTDEADFRHCLLQVARVGALREFDDAEHRDRFVRRLTLLGFLAATEPAEGDQLLRKVVAEATEDVLFRLRLSAEQEYRSVAEHFGLRPRRALFGLDPADADSAFEVIALMVNAASDGLLLRCGLDPAMENIELPTGDDGTTQTWSATGLAYFAIFSTCFEPDIEA